MANFAANPTDQDLIDLLTAAGLYNAQIGAYVPGFVSGAVNRFENSTGRIPFLQGNSAVYLYDPPGAQSQQGQNWMAGGSKILELQPYFTSISSIYIGVSVDSPGTPLDLQRQLVFEPNNDASMLEAIEWIEFLFPIYGLRQSVQVTGTPGSVAAWPADAFFAVVMGAAAALSGVIGASISGGTTSMKELDESVSYQPNPMKAFEDAWQSRFDGIVAAYKCLTMGL